MTINIIISVDIIRVPLTGIGRYAFELVKGLRYHQKISNLRYFSIYRWLKEPEHAFSSNHSLDQARCRLPFKPQIALLYGIIQSHWFKHQVERFPNHLLHVPNFILPPCNNPTITTLHDLSHIHYPKFHPQDRVAYLNRYLPKTLQTATHLITVSEFVRQELITMLGVSADRITTVHNGIDPIFQPYPIPKLIPVLQYYNLRPDNYLLVVGTLEPRKNLVRLVEAYAQLPSVLHRHYPLVLVGTKGWLTKSLERHLLPLERCGQLYRLGYVPQQHLPLLYAGAHAFSYPSLYEGFGLPVLEAMASGIPTLTSNRSSLPEVAGDAALLVDPEDVDALTAGLERLLTDSDWRAAAIERGLHQASRFSWTRCVDETVAVYERALAS